MQALQQEPACGSGGETAVQEAGPAPSHTTRCGVSIWEGKE